MARAKRCAEPYRWKAAVVSGTPVTQSDVVTVRPAGLLPVDDLQILRLRLRTTGSGQFARPPLYRSGCSPSGGASTLPLAPSAGRTVRPYGTCLSTTCRSFDFAQDDRKEAVRPASTSQEWVQPAGGASLSPSPRAKSRGLQFSARRCPNQALTIGTCVAVAGRSKWRARNCGV